jgi:hypothetical protein
MRRQRFQGEQKLLERLQYSAFMQFRYWLLADAGARGPDYGLVDPALTFRVS